MGRLSERRGEKKLLRRIIEQAVFTRGEKTARTATIEKLKKKKKKKSKKKKKKKGERRKLATDRSRPKF